MALAVWDVKLFLGIGMDRWKLFVLDKVRDEIRSFKGSGEVFS